MKCRLYEFFERIEESVETKIVCTRMQSRFMQLNWNSSGHIRWYFTNDIKQLLNILIVKKKSDGGISEMRFAMPFSPSLSFFLVFSEILSNYWNEFPYFFLWVKQNFSVSMRTKMVQSWNRSFFLLNRYRKKIKHRYCFLSWAYCELNWNLSENWVNLAFIFQQIFTKKKTKQKSEK